MNNKILSVVLVAGIATTGFAGISRANYSSNGSNFGNKWEIRQLLEKAESWETLTEEEQALLDAEKEKMDEIRYIGHVEFFFFSMTRTYRTGSTE